MGAKMTDREELIRLLSLEHRDAISVNQQKILELFDKQQNVIGDDARVYYRFGESEPAVVVKYYGKHKQYWHYAVYGAYKLFLYYQNGWIELRDDRKGKV
jgi:hypothetical protein